MKLKLTEDKKFKIIEISLLAVIFLLIVLIAVLILCYGKKTDVAEEPAVQETTEVTEKPSEEVNIPEIPLKRIYLVLDDGGHNIKLLSEFMKFPGKFTLAVLPELEYSSESAAMAYENGKTVILHQPMEALGGNNPGNGAIFVSTEISEVKNILNKNIDSIPYAVGINNHMGSAVTENSEIMRAVYQVLMERNLFFLDSFTHAKSVCGKVADEMNFRIARRNIFLDNDRDYDKIKAQFYKGKDYADNHGYVIMIGHVTSPELAKVMTDLYTEFTDSGYSFESIADFFQQNP